MVDYIEAPAGRAAPGGLLSVANIVPLNDFGANDGTGYQTEACGTALVVPGDLCGMTSVTFSQSGTTLTVTFSNAPFGLYTVTEDGVGAPVTKTAAGANMSLTFTVAAGPSVVDITSNTGIDTAVNLTFPLGAPTTVEVGEKIFQGVETVLGNPFTVYKGVDCQYLKGNFEDWARTALENGEGRAVEEAVLRSLLANSLLAPVDLTPGTGAVSIRTGVALLEGYAAQAYGGRPLMHASRTITSLALTDRAFQSDDAFHVSTRQGVPVANGGGYEINVGPGNVVPAAGEAWIYITGQVTLARTEIDTYGALDWTKNDQQAIAERTYVPLVECFIAAVRVKLENV